MDIAIAVILHPVERLILVGLRPSTSHLGGLWEFPGGKCKDGEALDRCAVRETKEETGLDVTIVEAWEPVVFTYPERQVTLWPFLCRSRQGNAFPHSTEMVRWVSVADLDLLAFPEGNKPILDRLKLWIALP